MTDGLRRIGTAVAVAVLAAALLAGCATAPATSPAAQAPDTASTASASVAAVASPGPEVSPSAAASPSAEAVVSAAPSPSALLPSPHPAVDPVASPTPTPPGAVFPITAAELEAWAVAQGLSCDPTVDDERVGGTWTACDAQGPGVGLRMSANDAGVVGQAWLEIDDGVDPSVTDAMRNLAHEFAATVRGRESATIAEFIDTWLGNVEHEDTKELRRDGYRVAISFELQDEGSEHTIRFVSDQYRLSPTR